MFLVDHWRRLSLWVDRSPLWFQLTLFPVVAPAVMAVAAACLCPRTAGVSVVLLAMVYGLAAEGGLIDWGGIGRSVGILYLGFVAHMYFGMLEHFSRRLWSRGCGCREAEESGEGSRGQAADA